jgi:anti-sigma factor RsiW
MQRMNGHISSTALSAWLDGEAGPAEERRVAAHLAACADCRSRLAATRRLVGGLQQLAPVPPPPGLAALIHGRVAAEAAGRTRGGAAGAAGSADGGGGGVRAWRGAVRLLRRFLRTTAWAAWGPQGLPPLHGSFSTARPLVSAGLALLVAVLLLQNGESGGPAPAPLVPRLQAGQPAGEPEFLVSEAFGEVPAPLPQTTSQVAGRVFVWSGDAWVQRGLDAGPAGQARAVPARSAAGRVLLAEHSDLGMLLADGSRVVLRYNAETVELWNGS